MSRALKYDIPGPDWRIAPDAVRERGWAAVFAPDLESLLRFVVEIGFGRGEFLLELAGADPDAAFVGVEYSAKRVLKLARRLARTKLRNVRLIEADAHRVVNELLPPDCVDAFWINFPDPWPKKRHHKRRLIEANFAREAALRLVPGGAVHVATDHVGYAEQVDAVLGKEPLLCNEYAPQPFVRDVPGRSRTIYELEWRAEGRPLHFFTYRRVRGPSLTVR